MPSWLRTHHTAKAEDHCMHHCSGDLPFVRESQCMCLLFLHTVVFLLSVSKGQEEARGRRKKNREGTARERSERKGNGTVREARGGKRKRDEREGKERCMHNYNWYFLAIFTFTWLAFFQKTTLVSTCEWVTFSQHEGGRQGRKGKDALGISCPLDSKDSQYASHSWMVESHHWAVALCCRRLPSYAEQQASFRTGFIQGRLHSGHQWLVLSKGSENPVGMQVRVWRVGVRVQNGWPHINPYPWAQVRVYPYCYRWVSLRQFSDKVFDNKQWSTAIWSKSALSSMTAIISDMNLSVYGYPLLTAGPTLTWPCAEKAHQAFHVHSVYVFTVCKNVYKFNLDPHELPFAGFAPTNPLKTRTHTC